MDPWNNSKILFLTIKKLKERYGEKKRKVNESHNIKPSKHRLRFAFCVFFLYDRTAFSLLLTHTLK
jgi:hypothetical protein